MKQDEIPGAIVDLADACVRQVGQAVGLVLDYTPETLPFLDHYLASSTEGAGSTLGVAELLAAQAGAYFGEVVRRQFLDVDWALLGDDCMGYRLEFRDVFLAVFPMQIAHGCIVQEGDDRAPQIRLLPEDLGDVMRSVAVVHRVNPQDYYRLAVRFELVSHVADLLATRQGVRASDALLRFDHAIYESVLGSVSAVS